MRIRKEDLKRRIDYLNQLTSSPVDEFHTIGKVDVSNVGHYKLHGGAYALGIYRIQSADGAMTEVIEYQEPNELLQLLNTFIRGIEAQQVDDRSTPLESVGAKIDSKGWIVPQEIEKDTDDRVHISNSTEEWIGELSEADWFRVSRWFKLSSQILIDQKRNQRFLNVPSSQPKTFSAFIENITQEYVGTLTREDSNE